MNTQRDLMYVVWMSRGMGMYPGAKFRCLEDALRHVRERQHKASFAIRMPDGAWHQRDDSGRVIFPQAAQRAA